MTGDIQLKPRAGYRVIERIGRGAFGDVFLCDWEGHEAQICLKEVDLQLLSPTERNGCLEEVAVLRRLPRHQHIVSLLDAFYDSDNPNLLLLALEFADAGDLAQFVSDSQDSIISGRIRRSEHQKLALRLFVQIADGVAFLHERHILHRDLKPQNVFLVEDKDGEGNIEFRPVIGDFGSSKTLASSSALAETIVGSPLYMSPELLESEPHGTSTDIWSLGCILYELLVGQPPFKAPSYPAVVRKITNGDFTPLTPEQASDEIRELVSRMLHRDPNQRPTASEIIATQVFKEYLSPKVFVCEATEVIAEPSVQIEHCNYEEKAINGTHEQTWLLCPPPAPAVLDYPAPLVTTSIQLEESAQISNVQHRVIPNGIHLPQHRNQLKKDDIEAARQMPSQMLDKSKLPESLSLPAPPPVSTRALRPSFASKTHRAQPGLKQDSTTTASSRHTTTNRNINANIRTTTTTEQLLIVGVGISSRRQPTSNILKSKAGQ